jgi:hypothetical protein
MNNKNKQVVEQIKKYITTYAANFPLQKLKENLSAAGYRQEDINEAVAALMEAGGSSENSQEQQPSRSKSFFNFTGVKIYKDNQEKALDFFVGLFGKWIATFFFLLSFNVLGILMDIAAYFFALYYFYNRRRYIFYGLLMNLVGAGVIVFLIYLFNF